MADNDEREPANDPTDAQASDDDSTDSDLLPDADPKPTGGAKYSKDEKVNYGEDMLP